MITKRIIPCLDVKDGRVVKGTNFQGLRNMADPVEMARYYNQAGADELVFTTLPPAWKAGACSPTFCAGWRGRSSSHSPWAAASTRWRTLTGC